MLVTLGVKRLTEHCTYLLIHSWHIQFGECMIRRDTLRALLLKELFMSIFQLENSNSMNF